MILKLSFLCLFLSINSFAISVLISKEAIKFEEKLDASKVRLQNVNEINKACIPLKLSEIQNNHYLTTHYINKYTIICISEAQQ